MESADADTYALVAHIRKGNLSGKQLDDRIAGLWNDWLGSEAGRSRIAGALGVAPEDLRPGPSPLVLQDASSGFADPVTLALLGKWTATYIVAPVLVGLVKDELKERLARLAKAMLSWIRNDNELAVQDTVLLPKP